MNLLPKPEILRELLGESGYGKVKENSKSFILTCPRCKKKDKLYIRKMDGRFVCWYCKERDNFYGSPEYVFHELLGRPINQLRAEIWGGQAPKGTILISIAVKDFFGDDDEVAGILADAPLFEVEPDPGFRDLDTEWGIPGRLYLESRGIPLDIAIEYGIKYWPAQQRIVFPVVHQGKLVGWQSRSIVPTEWLDDEDNIVKIPKALTYSGLKKDRVLMFGDRVNGSHAVLCEGPIDAIKAHLCGGNVASLGKAVSGYQLQLLRNSGITKLYMGLDPDAAPEVESIVNQLYDSLEIYDMRPKSGDLGAMSFEEVYELYKNAPRLNKGSIFLYLDKDVYGVRHNDC